MDSVALAPDHDKAYFQAGIADTGHYLDRFEGTPDIEGRAVIPIGELLVVFAYVCGVLWAIVVGSGAGPSALRRGSRLRQARTVYGRDDAGSSSCGRSQRAEMMHR